MFIIADKKIPGGAKERLSTYGKLIEFESSGITEESISGHPDIFLCSVDGQLIIASNLPDEYLRLLNTNCVDYIKGETDVSEKYPASAVYNASISENFLVHRVGITDPAVLKIANCTLDSRIHRDITGHERGRHNREGRNIVDVNQGYARCTTLPLNENRFITSDEGIYRALSEKKIEVIYVSPKKIILPGHKNGFFGGCCGIHNENIFILGKLDKFPQGKEVREYLKSNKYEIIELYDGPLF